MAPLWPEEVDVFTVPHSRMKKLIHKYNNLITTTNFKDETHLKTLLQNLFNVFSELKAHEQIENNFIMKKLRRKLRAASVTSAAVCNCHSDNRLTDMLELVLDGYKMTQRTEVEREVYGMKLSDALEDFTQNFLPHMEEEEQVFQPLLIEFFSYEELKELKAKVIHQHHLSNSKKRAEQEKFVEDEVTPEEDVEPTCHFDKLPNELLLNIFSHLNPKELMQVGIVSHRWNQLTKDPSLWTQLYPVHWAQGNWTFCPEPMGGVDGVGPPETCYDSDKEEEEYFASDEDADIDESGNSDKTKTCTDDTHAKKKTVGEMRLINCIVKYLLPQAGIGVKVCDLAYSKTVNSSLIHKILKQCPNLEVLDLTHTNVTDGAFKEFCLSGRQSKLRHLDLTGCQYITDVTLECLSGAVVAEHTEFLATAYDSSDDWDEKDIDTLDDSSENETDLCSEEKETDTLHDNLEIENVPPPCNENLSLCCQRLKTGERCRDSVIELDQGNPAAPLCCNSTQRAQSVSNCKNVGSLSEDARCRDIGMHLDKCSKASSCCNSRDSPSWPSAGSREDSGCLPEGAGCRDCGPQSGQSSPYFPSCSCLRSSVGGSALVQPKNVKSEICNDLWQDADSSSSGISTDGFDADVFQGELGKGGVTLDDSAHSEEVSCFSETSSDCVEEEEVHRVLHDTDCCGSFKKESPTCVQLCCDSGSVVTEKTFCGNGKSKCKNNVAMVGDGNSSETFSEVTEATSVEDFSPLCQSSCRINKDILVASNGCAKKALLQCCGTPQVEEHSPLYDENCKNMTESSTVTSQLEFLSLNGCYRITDLGLSLLSQGEGTPQLRHLDLSGCVSITGQGVAQLVSTCHSLDHAQLYYCDNLWDDPFPTTASGCRNLECDRRYCCSYRE